MSDQDRSLPTNEESDADGLTVQKALSGERERRRRNLLRDRRRIQIARAALVGAVAGAVGVAFQLSLYAAEAMRTEVLEWSHYSPLWGWAVLPVIGAATGAAAGLLTTRFAPEASGSGIPHVKGVLLHLRPMRWKKVIPVKFVGGLLSIGGGLSMGREGPTVQMGAAAGQLVSSLLRIPRRAQGQLVACGGGAGLAAAFNAPLAGFIFVLEELQRELSFVTYSMALTATVCAVVVTRSMTGQLPSFHIRGYPTPPLTALPLFVVVGVLAGLLGVLFGRGLVFSMRTFQDRLRAPRWAHPAIVGLMAGLTAWFLPQAVGSGHLAAEKVLSGHYADQILLVALMFGAKFVLTLLSYGSGAPGGIFAPMLLLGALAGLFVGQVSALFAGSLSATPAAFAVVGMAAFFSAVVRAPLTGIVLILEMTANYEQLFPLLVACLTAYLVSEHFGEKPIYERLLEMDLHRSAPRSGIAEEPVLVEVVVEPGSRMDGRQVRDLGLPQGCLLVTVSRAGREVAPSGQTRLRPGDHVTFIVAGAPLDVVAQVQTDSRAG